MKFKYETEIQKTKRLKMWHFKFLWLPVKTEDGEIYWLQKIQRRMLVCLEFEGVPIAYRWEYKEI